MSGVCFLNMTVVVVFQVYEHPGGGELPLPAHVLRARGQLLHPCGNEHSFFNE